MSSGEPGKERRGVSLSPARPRYLSHQPTEDSCSHLASLAVDSMLTLPNAWHCWQLQAWTLRSCLCLTLAWTIFHSTSPTLVLTAHRISTQLGSKICDGITFLPVYQKALLSKQLVFTLRTITQAQCRVYVCCVVSGCVGNHL